MHPLRTGSAEARRVAYRADIDGLRGIAVLAVVAYHLGIGPTGGGFVGVDMFFVISGFLITAIVQAEIETGSFTFLRFYERRVRRLFPALFVVLLATIVGGTWLLLPSDLVLLGKSTAATLVFASNVFFWRNSGYFDSASEINPLLHTWSLAVEEQFYIGLPMLLLLTYRYWRGHLPIVLTLVACVSLAACVLIQPLRPSAVFYLSPFRAWELLAGALLAIGAVPAFAHRRHREAASAVALVLVAAAIVSSKSGIGYPGWQAIVPVVGTAVLIHVGTSGGSTVHRLLQSRPLVKVGLVSYSLYLWHWPLIAFARYRNGLEPLGEWRWLILAVALVAAALSYRFVEQPFRRRKPAATAGNAFIKAAMAAGLVGTTSAIVVAGAGWPARFTGEVIALDKERRPPIPFIQCEGNFAALQGDPTPCMLGIATEKPSLVLWGDSHALAWAPAFDALLKSHGAAGILASSMACPPLMEVNSTANADCRDYNRRVQELLRRPGAPRTVVMVADWPEYTQAEGWLKVAGKMSPTGNRPDFGPLLRATVKGLHEDGRSVWIIGPTPGAPSSAPLRCAMARMNHRALPVATSAHTFKSDSDSFYAAVSSIQQVTEVRVTDPAPWFCGIDHCAFMDKGRLLYRDGGHLNPRGAAYLEPFLAPVLAMQLDSGGRASGQGRGSQTLGSP